MSGQEVANAFVGHYYPTFDSNVDALTSLFTEKSMMTWESNQIQGGPNIIAKLKSFGTLRHTVKTVDVQPSVDPNALLIFVTGSVVLDQQNPLHFCELFQLVQSGQGQYVVHNSIFRLNYGM